MYIVHCTYYIKYKVNANIHTVKQKISSTTNRLNSTIKAIYFLYKYKFKTDRLLQNVTQIDRYNVFYKYYEI